MESLFLEAAVVQHTDACDRITVARLCGCWPHTTKQVELGVCLELFWMARGMYSARRRALRADLSFFGREEKSSRARAYWYAR